MRVSCASQLVNPRLELGSDQLLQLPCTELIDGLTLLAAAHQGYRTSEEGAETSGPAEIVLVALS